MGEVFTASRLLQGPPFKPFAIGEEWTLPSLLCPSLYKITILHFLLAHLDSTPCLYQCPHHPEEGSSMGL